MMTILLLLCILATVQMPVYGKHAHICGRSNHNHSTGELLPHNGIIPAGHECLWHIYPELYNIPEVFMIVEDFQLDKNDEFTISKHEGENLFGPFSGTKDSFTILTGFLYLDVLVKMAATPLTNRTFKAYFTTNDCYYLIEEESGTMTSPLYHDVKTRKNITCTWRFKKFKHVTLPRIVVFETFHLTKSNLTIKGSKAQDGLYTGTKLPPNVVAFGETQFLLDLDTTVPGETFSFKHEPDGVNVPTPLDQLIDDGKPKSTLNSSLQSPHACGHTVLKDKNGLFGPKNYTMMASHSCMWTVGPVDSPRGVYIVIVEYDVIGDDQFLIQQSSTGLEIFGPYFGNKAPFSFFSDEATIDAFLRISSTDLLRKRHFKGFYSTSGCDFPITDGFGIMHSPVYKLDDQKKTTCSWAFVLRETSLVIMVSFDNYNIKSSTLQVYGSLNQDQMYKGTDGPFDILMRADGKLTLEIDRAKENETLSFSYNTVSSECSDYIKIMKKETTTLSFPSPGLGEKNSVNCQWIIEGDKNGVLAVYFDEISLRDAKDLLLIKEGKTRRSPNLVMVAEDNQEMYKGSYIVASTDIIWVSYITHSAFKGSHFKISVNISQERNYLNKGQEFSIAPAESGVDVIFYLEVGNEEQVLLTLPDQELPSSGVILIYDGFNGNTVLAKIQKDKAFYPVVATGSKMMVVAKEFIKGSSVKLRFDGIKKGCHQVTLNQRGTYSLSGNCNNTCSWTILPKSDDSEEMLSLRMASVALRPNDVIEVRKLDNTLTLIETIKSNSNNRPNIYLPASYGANIKVIRASCLSSDTESTAFFASAETVRGCSMNINMKPGEKVSLTSPNYPDVYPFNSKCYWNVSTHAKNLYVSFQTFQLANGHCVKIYEMDNSGHVGNTVTYDSSITPGDKMFGNIISFQLVASPCTVVNLTTPTSGNGFVVDVFAIDCGGTVGKEMKGTFNTPGYPKPIEGSMLCIWHVEMPPHNKDGSVNVILFSMKWSSSTDDETGLTIYDGPSLLSEVLVNKTTTEGLMSRTSSIIFMYQQNGTSDHAALQVDFESRTGTMLCDNGIYMHPDWICNDVDDCGDYSDEKNCKGRIPPPSPVPPLPPNINVTKSGVSSAVFWSVVPAVFIFGIISTIGVACIIKERKRRRQHMYETMPIVT